MSVHALHTLRDPAGAADAARHLRLWLAVTGIAYGASGRELFVRAHPALFGAQFEAALRGYSSWRDREGVHDTAEAFAEYIAPRHDPWIQAQGVGNGMAPCLTGTGKSLPCWSMGHLDEETAHPELRLAA